MVLGTLLHGSTAGRSRPPCICIYERRRYSGRPSLSMRFSEAAAMATSVGDQLLVPVALGRRDLCRCAWHRARTWRHDDRRIRMTLTDLTVDIVPIVRPIAGKRR